MTERSLEFLDLWDLDSGPRAENLLRQFYLLCIENFPDEDEREDLAQWADRLWGRARRLPAPEPFTHIVLTGYGLRDQPAPIVIGGIAAEYYRNSRCGLLTYIVVKPECRNRGIARQLQVMVEDILRADAQKDGNQLEAFFAEANDPRIVSGANDSIEPSRRLRILAAMGAKWIKIPYVQPKLGTGKSRVRHLLLLAFPVFARNRVDIVSNVLRGFLEEFYLALEGVVLGTDPDFGKMNEHLAADVFELQDLPIDLVSKS